MKIVPSKSMIIPGILVAFAAIYIANKFPQIKAKLGG